MDKDRIRKDFPRYDSLSGLTRSVLGEMEVQVRTARGLLSAGERLSALYALLEAIQASRQVIVALMTGCLQDRLERLRNEDLQGQKAVLDEITRLVMVVYGNLCPACRRRLAEMLKEG